MKISFGTLIGLSIGIYIGILWERPKEAKVKVVEIYPDSLEAKCIKCKHLNTYYIFWKK